MDHTHAVPGAPAGSTSSAEPPVSRSLLAQVASAGGSLLNPLGRQPAESLLAAVRAAAAPGMWQPPGADTAPTPAPVAPVAPPMAAAPPVTLPSPAPVAASRPAPLAPRAMPAPAPSQPSASTLWAGVVADTNVRAGFNADGTPQAHGGRLSFTEPRAGRSAGPVWDAVAAKLNAEVRAQASAGEPAATGGQPADIWADVAASVNAEGRAANASFVTPGQHHGAHSARPRIS